MGAPDVSFMIEAYQSLQSSVDANPPTSWPGPQKVTAIAGELCKKIGLPLENNGVDVTVSDAYLSGSYLNQLRTLCDMARCQLWVEPSEGLIAIAPIGTPRSQDPVVMNSELGLLAGRRQRTSALISCACTTPASTVGDRSSWKPALPRVPVIGTSAVWL